MIDRAARLFGLSLEQSEFLANSAGLSLSYEKINLTEYLEYHGTLRMLCERAMVSERMLRYYKTEVPAKQPLLAIAVSLAMPVDEMDILLRKYGYCLSASIAGDAVIRWHTQTARRRGQGGEALLFEINEVLERMALPLLMTRQI